ncbi:DNA helicase UvrD [Halorientalis marina]|uniref:DNA helicase UvrD n=1 Tax=Halorientalis marina TaxID=2931976 RepID=UPI001FF58B5A|nr:DNA helicase UvrD [Halorientalis marina]
MSSRTPSSPLSGTLHHVPFLGDDPATRVAPLYAELVAAHTAADVLVLKRFPTGIETFTDRLAHETDSIERPRVDAVGGHARTLLQATPESPTILTDTERSELAYQYIQDIDWTTPYLATAADHERFTRDVGRLMNIASWRGEPIDATHPALNEIGDHHQRFQAWLAENGYVERGHLLSHVIDQFDADNIDADTLDFEALLVVEYEEFASIDRAYLDRLVTHADCDLTCVAERESSIQRVWNEPGTVGGTVAHEPDDAAGEPDPESRPDAVANLLATGDVPPDPDDGAVAVVHEPTFADQIRRIADEIERLRRDHDWRYDDFAIGFRDSNEPIAETIRLLHQAGIPTASTSVSGFGDDPAVRELRSLITYLATDDEAQRERLAGRGIDIDVALFETLDSEESTLEGTLRRWALETDLKERIAREDDSLEAKAQFSHVRDVFELAAFLDESPLLDATWDSLQDALDRAVRTAATETQTAETDVKDDGVLVDAVRVMKNASWEAVFMCNLVEGTYPTDPNLTGLFPTTEVAEMPGYPGVTDLTAADVRETFPTADGPNADRIHDPFRRYYQELSRRQLAVGARAATDRLYLGLFDEAAGELDRKCQPSRYLIAIYEAFPWLDSLDHDGIHGESGAIDFALSRVDRALTRVKGADVRGETIDLDETERDLAAIQDLLAASGQRGDQLCEAVRARVDFAAGEVRRDE